MTLTPGKLILAKDYPADDDARAYVASVESADGQSLEPAVIAAYDNFIVGCKADGIWNAIKASCILAGARTLSGALVPLVGTAPTNNGPFLAADYDRKTGLVGDGSTKYLDSNRTPAQDPQNSLHNSAYITEAQVGGNLVFIGSLDLGVHYSVIIRGTGWAFANNTPDKQFGVTLTTIPATTTGFFGHNRNSSSAFNLRAGNGYTFTDSTSPAANSAPGSTFPYFIFARNYNGTADFKTSARIAFYSIGESLDLALLDTRVSTLISDLGAAIP